ncbi:alpha/beta fold hydrolase [Hymenobacter fodinae]|uniref:Alpha/beta fold hydrolase n=1 Tax=Hymenobacter fodinae TaxID=2510796 RepID=A0A4Z0P2W5_9BACT|nr:alpha/beta fold hydrolase [Hymenobacter fodinae]TGE05459.1 alpha/beta fold hydrolase [Hymenobacter fodinae]
MHPTATSSKNREVFIVPRWAGAPHSDWYPWLSEQLQAVAAEDGLNYHVHALDMPAWDLPVIERAVDYLIEVLPPAKLGPHVFLVGHSVGCLAILHYLARVAEQHPEASQIGGVLCVAGWFSVDSPWQDILNWMHAPINFEAARRLIPEDKLTVLLSDDDPYTSGYQDNERLWVERLRSQVSILAGRQHFSSQLDFDVRDAVRDLAGALSAPLHP